MSSSGWTNHNNKEIKSPKHLWCCQGSNQSDASLNTIAYGHLQLCHMHEVFNFVAVMDLWLSTLVIHYVICSWVSGSASQVKQLSLWFALALHHSNEAQLDILISRSWSGKSIPILIYCQTHLSWTTLCIPWSSSTIFNQSNRRGWVRIYHAREPYSYLLFRKKP